VGVWAPQGPQESLFGGAIVAALPPLSPLKLPIAD